MDPISVTLIIATSVVGLLTTVITGIAAVQQSKCKGKILGKDVIDIELEQTKYEDGVGVEEPRKKHHRKNNKSKKKHRGDRDSKS